VSTVVSERSVSLLEARDGEGVVVSHDEQPGGRDESGCGPDDSGYDVLECAKVMAEVRTFLDGECTDETRVRVCNHLEACENCLRYYTLEGRIKNLIATKCGGDMAPEWLR
jgi:mycothiol system anti-sigma-R factor